MIRNYEEDQEVFKERRLEAQSMSNESPIRIVSIKGLQNLVYFTQYPKFRMYQIHMFFDCLQ
jgi:hypothetical protein